VFDNDRPTVMYNPHFDASTSSIGIAAQVIERFRQQQRYNLIFAPHIRAVEDFTLAQRQAFEALAMPGRVLIDLGSPSLFDMRYVQAADLYLGDMSSQLYEFLARPRPVAFINAHGVDWQHESRHAGWHLGEVASGADDVLDAVDRAFAGHSAKQVAQEQAVAFAFGDYRGAIGRGADLLLEYLATAARGSGKGAG
jgi:CDP-glycerol glycerophosphotransferase (TagB/SpsB family)